MQKVDAKKAPFAPPPGAKGRHKTMQKRPDFFPETRVCCPPHAVAEAVWAANSVRVAKDRLDPKHSALLIQQPQA